MKHLTRFLALTTLLISASPAFAWNATGHETVAAIAWADLKPEVREKVTAILRKHPFVKSITPGETAPGDADQQVFMLAATWPDIVRGSKNPEEKAQHHGEWHYVDFPILAPGADGAAFTYPDYSAAPAPGQAPANILHAYAQNLAILKDDKATDSQRAIALCWVEHQIGDIHQPLHSCGFFSADYPTGDRGGNLFTVKNHNVVTNLHSYWDQQLGGFATWTLLAAVTAKTAEANPRSNFAKELSVTAFNDWAAESFVIARDVVYQNGKLPNLPKDKMVADKSLPVPELPDGYDKAAKEIAAQRAALAGYRLADVLNAAFATPTPIP